MYNLIKLILYLERNKLINYISSLKFINFSKYISYSFTTNWGII